MAAFPAVNQDYQPAGILAAGLWIVIPGQAHAFAAVQRELRGGAEVNTALPPKPLCGPLGGEHGLHKAIAQPKRGTEHQVNKLSKVFS